MLTFEYICVQKKAVRKTIIFMVMLTGAHNHNFNGDAHGCARGVRIYILRMYGSAHPTKRG